MKVILNNKKNMLRGQNIIALVLFLMQKSYAQTPTHLPKTGIKPVEINFINILVYFIIPLLLAVFYIWYRRSLKGKLKEREQNKGNKN